ncbi:MAG: hypothetical protein M0Q90_00260 [Bacteroidales bacterium]|nr:hypothetical protein [Bacteroidales bacterium]
MKYQQGQDKEQMHIFPVSMEATISHDNEVWMIELFVENIDMEILVFVEHPYGTIKRQWGFNYVMIKQTIQRASDDIGLVFTAYNLRRILNIIGKESLRYFLFGFLMPIALFLVSLELFWRTQKKQSQKLIENLPSLQREYLLS